ncbi:MAG: MotA/TolQ/ExbB proton channel family protein [Coriobacteriales bacterium]|jgi:biopolymer transport protein ExbB/TolQ|nr:MotA/TolQ/ExbB proton channel family protein [Coriobacteriales bacterium]
MENPLLADALRSIAEVLLNPVLIVLMVFMATTVVMLGSLAVEFFTEVKRLTRAFPALIKELRSGRDIKVSIASSRILRRQKAALLDIVDDESLTPAIRESLAVRVLERERARYDRLTFVTDIIARLGPAFGLIATLIPLGPGVVALGQGDTATLSSAMLTAFDATVAGLISSGISFIISGVRKRVYAGYLASFETVMEIILERLDSKGTQPSEDSPAHVRIPS